ncbi:hypothetical protein, partial [Vibrio parahaemolyticus]
RLGCMCVSHTLTARYVYIGEFNLINTLVGIVIGFTFTIWYVALDLRFDIDSALSVNVVIAIATVTATAIHFDSVRRQKKDRVWEINKEILLKLFGSLSTAAQASLDQMNFELESMNDHTVKQPDVDRENYKTLTKSLNESLTLYAPMLPDNVIEAIKKHKSESEKISEAYNNDFINIIEAYDSDYGNHVELLGVLDTYIKRIAGTKYT